MKYVEIERTDTGYWLDPTTYLEQLESMAPSLPTGARAFATDPDHYDFRSGRCIKDLKVASVTIREDGHAQVLAEIVFGMNKWKHDEDLIIRYEGVAKFYLDVDPLHGETQVWPESRRLGDVQLDEILPITLGCSHEMQMTGGRLLIECLDLRAEWVESAASGVE